MCLSPDIISAVEFDNFRTVHQAITRIQEYLTNSVQPLPLQQLNVIRLVNSGGETQSQITHRTIDTFRNAQMFDMNSNELLKVVLLHTIQEKPVMIEVLRQLHSRHNWADVRDIILKIDSINNLGGEYLGAKGGLPALQANVAQPNANKNKTCDRCGRRGHIRAGCKTPKEKLKCTFCPSEGIHSMHACRQRKKAEKNGNKPPADSTVNAIYGFL